MFENIGNFFIFLGSVISSISIIAGVVGVCVSKSMKKINVKIDNLKDELNDKLYEQDVRDCRIQLNFFLNKVESNGLESIDDQELELYSNLYDHYTEDLGKNSFIHDKWKRVMLKTKK